MAADSEKVAALLDAKNYAEAEKLLKRGIREFPNDRALHNLAFRLYKATKRPKIALKTAQRLIDLEPDHWKGYARASRCLDDLGSTQAAIAILEKGLKQQPKNRRLTKIAFRLCNKLKHRKAFQYQLKLAFLCPKKIKLQTQTILNLIHMGKTKKAEKLLKKAISSSPGCNQLIELEKKMNHYISTNQERFSPKQMPPSICIAGNCQIQAISEWLEESFPFSQIKCLEPYHLIEHQSTIDNWMEDIKSADMIFMIPVKEGFNGFRFGSEKASKECHQESLFISYPSFHFEAFYPLFGYVKTKTGATLRGKDLQHSDHLYGDYHDFLAMQLSQETDGRIEKFFHAIYLTEKDHYKGSTVIHNVAVNSFLQFSKRYPNYADILQDNLEAGTGHTFNHPGNQFLQKMYLKIWTKALKCDAAYYIPYTKDPLNQLQLPIPSFVTRSLTSTHFQHPWEASGQIEARTSLQDYVPQIKTSINLYKSYPSIFDHNASHQKLALARNFINEMIK